MKKLVVLSGAGVSAESGIKTFRDSDGLWENYDVRDVASIEGWYRDRKTVLNFYNDRRRQIEQAQPNEAHLIIAELQKWYDVVVATQNIDNLHERAGSKNVIHLHGEITKVRPEDREDSGIVDIGYKDVNFGDTDKRGVQLRPHIVWFGEAVPKLEEAAGEVSKADILLIIGTSLAVYPAAGLVRYVNYGIPIYLIDPKRIDLDYNNFTQIQDVASKGMERLKELLLNNK
ncbi:MAG: NAD-dependent deacylase [Bacteroidales bacterium]|nr:NAD-dependent deacylase [Bacteroidales bacterium]MDD3201066.1 NAD-dependent deacylase [Bacteroidales bacterium]